MERDPSPNTLADLARAAIALGDFLRERDGRIGRHGLPFVERMGAVQVRLLPLTEHMQTPIWRGWPLTVPPLVADIAAATQTIERTLGYTAAEVNTATGPSSRRFATASESDIRVFRDAGRKLLGMIGPPPIAARVRTPTLGMASCADLAAKHGIPPESLGKALQRHRASNDDGYHEVQTRRSNEPRYLYAEASVLPVIERLKARASRPTKSADGRRTGK